MEVVPGSRDISQLRLISTLAIRPRASTARQPRRHPDVTFMGDC